MSTPLCRLRKPHPHLGRANPLLPHPHRQQFQLLRLPLLQNLHLRLHQLHRQSQVQRRNPLLLRRTQGVLRLLNPIPRPLQRPVHPPPQVLRLNRFRVHRGQILLFPRKMVYPRTRSLGAPFLVLERHGEAKAKDFGGSSSGVRLLLERGG